MMDLLRATSHALLKYLRGFLKLAEPKEAFPAKEPKLDCPD
jgi:hypothetical protein